MATDTFKLELVTPDRLLLSEPARSVIIPGGDGEFQVLVGHHPMVSTLRPGVLVVETPTERYTYAVGTGFIEVQPDHVIVLASEAEGEREIDIEAARAAARQAEDRLANLGHESLDERVAFQTALEVAQTQIQLYEQREHKR